MATYTYCTTARSVCEAVSILKQSEILAVDTEGEEIGKTEGKLSIISVGSVDAVNIFLFDIVALARPEADLNGGIRPLLTLLTSPKFLKLMWDGRQDYFEIYELYGVKMVNVLDLQVVELFSRWEKRREKEKHRKIRISKGFFGYAPVRNNPELYEGMHLVSGMQKCVEEFGLNTAGKDPEIKNLYKQFGSAVWMERPLRPMLLSYAAVDIELISDLYFHFFDNDWITHENIPTFVLRSQNYIKSRLGIGRIVQNNAHSQNALVLEEIFNSLPKCGTCSTILPRTSFATRRSKKGSQMRCSQCRRCVAISVKRGLNTEIWVHL
jgi:exonuclease 3'-5' domain-containing protein 1